MDHTLIPIDSGDLWAKWLVEEGGLEPELIRRIEGLHDEYIEGVVDHEALISIHFELMSRFDRSTLNRLRAEFIQKVVMPKLHPAAMAVVEQKKDEGGMLVVASGTPFYVVSSIAPLFGISTVIAAKGEVDESGRFTGRLQGGHSYGEGKARLVAQWLDLEATQGRRYEDVEAWSDSINDLPLLNWAESLGGRSVAVNPDVRLSAYAADKGWEVKNLFLKE